jgi:hypothetical protein
MNKLLITGFLILSSLNCFSTCIAIYVANNGNIYVAADSRRTFLFNDDKDKIESICKIHNVGNNYFAISGFDDGGLLKAANESLQENSDIGTAIKSFGTVMTKHYKKLMDEAKEFYPDKLQTFVKDGLADVSFFGFYNGSPKVINVVFTLSLEKNGKPLVAYKVRPVLDFTVIGISRDIINASPEDLPSKGLREEHPELYVEGLVKIEAKKQPLAVSEPIDLLELKPDGAVWIRKNENTVAYE